MTDQQMRAGSEGQRARSSELGFHNLEGLFAKAAVPRTQCTERNGHAAPMVVKGPSRVPAYSQTIRPDTIPFNQSKGAIATMLPPSDECPMNWFFIQSELNGDSGGKVDFRGSFLGGAQQPKLSGQCWMSCGVCACVCVVSRRSTVSGFNRDVRCPEMTWRVAVVPGCAWT
eukprot:2129717-Rhodomonas_salina.1